MKKILLLCSLILIGCGGQTHEDGPFTWYHENGNIRTEGTYKNDIMVGVMKSYYEDGTLQLESTRKENGQNGISKNYYKDGTLSGESTYSYENPNDKWTEYLFKTSKSYNEDGRLEQKETRDNRGVSNGPHIQYYLAPKYKNNDGDRLESTRVNEDIEGPAVYYWADGDREERTYVNNIVEGPAVYYYADGRREERTYVNGKQEGSAVFYASDSGKWKGDREEFTYVNGKQEGPSVYYWVNGNREERTYVNGKKEGPAVYYYADGRTKNKTYVNGKSQSSSSSKSYNSSSGSQKGLYDLRKGEITFRIVVTDSEIDGILYYNGFNSVYGVEGNVNGTIKDNTLYEGGVMRIGSIDRNGKWIKYDGHTIYK